MARMLSPLARLIPGREISSAVVKTDASVRVHRSDLGHSDALLSFSLTGQ